MAIMSGGQAVVKALMNEGIDVVFGVPGVQIMHIYDGFFNQSDIEQNFKILVIVEGSKCIVKVEGENPESLFYERELLSQQSYHPSKKLYISLLKLSACSQRIAMGVCQFEFARDVDQTGLAKRS